MGIWRGDGRSCQVKGCRILKKTLLFLYVLSQRPENLSVLTLTGNYKEMIEY